jgi:predicted phosphodiesterase
MKKIILLSDTHHTLDERIFPHLETCDEIWHAGDIGKLEVTDQLKTFAPLRAVWGNIDDHSARKEFRETTYFKCEQVKVI